AFYRADEEISAIYTSTPRFPLAEYVSAQHGKLEVYYRALCPEGHVFNIPDMGIRKGEPIQEERINTKGITTILRRTSNGSVRFNLDWASYNQLLSNSDQRTQQFFAESAVVTFNDGTVLNLNHVTLVFDSEPD